MGTVFSGLVLTGHDLDFPGLFYTSLFICLVFSEWAWGLISSLQSELFPTGIRSTAVGVLTGLTGFAGAVVVLSQGMLDAAGFLTVSILLWAAGLAATMAWYIRGPETANRPVDEIEEELKAQHM